DREALAALAEARRGRGADPVEVDQRAVEEDAELVAAEAERLAAIAHGAAEPRAQAGEQHVAGAVAERVVVRLEAVEVEQQQQLAGLRLRRERLVESQQERAPVREAGERIRQGLRSRPAEQREVLVERQRESRDHG